MFHLPGGSSGAVTRSWDHRLSSSSGAVTRSWDHRLSSSSGAVTRSWDHRLSSSSGAVTRSWDHHLRDSMFTPCAAVLNRGHCFSSPSCMIEYLAINTLGYLYMNSLNP